jgi:hypothetical protein
MNDTRKSPDNKPRLTRTTLFASLTLVLIAAGAGWLLGNRQANLPSDDPAGQAGLSDPQQASSHTSARNPPPMGIGNGSNNAESPSAPVTEDHGARLLGFPSMSIDALRALQLRNQQQLESSFARDPIDPTAAAVELGMLKTMVDPALTGDHIAPGNPEVKCHQNSCRISADFNSSDDASSWAVNYLTMLGGKLGRSQPTMTVKPDGSVRMDLYGTRQR